MRLDFLDTIGKEHYNAVICKYNNYINDYGKNYDLLLDDYFTNKKEAEKAIKSLLKSIENINNNELNCFIVKINKKGHYITIYNHYLK